MKILPYSKNIKYWISLGPYGSKFTEFYTLWYWLQIGCRYLLWPRKQPWQWCTHYRLLPKHFQDDYQNGRCMLLWLFWLGKFCYKSYCPNPNKLYNLVKDILALCQICNWNINTISWCLWSVLFISIIICIDVKCRWLSVMFLQR